MLHPPFKASSMEGLYKKIMKGQYGKINSRYSRDICKIVRWLLMVDANERPNCDEILRNEIVKERIDFFSDREGFNEEDDINNEDKKLMKSFRYTKNMRFMRQQLPDPNYDNNNYSLPNINKTFRFNNGINPQANTKNELKLESPKKLHF